MANRSERPHRSLNKAVECARVDKKSFGTRQLIEFCWFQNLLTKESTNCPPILILKSSIPKGIIARQSDIDEKFSFSNSPIVKHIIHDGDQNHPFDPGTTPRGTKVRWETLKGKDSISIGSIVLTNRPGKSLIKPVNAKQQILWVPTDSISPFENTSQNRLLEGAPNEA